MTNTKIWSGKNSFKQQINFSQLLQEQELQSKSKAFYMLTPTLY